MANLTEISQWDSGVYQIETSDPVIGGEDGINNKAVKSLANRTLWLKNKLAEAIEYKGVLAADTALTSQVAPLLDLGRLVLTSADYGKLITSNSTGGTRGAELPSAAAGALAPIGTFFGFTNYVDYVQGLGNKLTIWVKWGPGGASSDIIIDPISGIALKSIVIGPGDSVTLVKIAESVWMAVNRSFAPKPGKVEFYASNTLPIGFLKCNGAVVLKSAYPRLYSAIGDTYESLGDPTDENNFRLPEFRGEFLRIFDDGRGHDAGRTMGSVQDEQVGDHTHPIPTIDEDDQSPSGAENLVGTIQGPSAAISFRDSDTSGAGQENIPQNVTMAAFIRY